MNRELIKRMVETPTEQNFEALGNDYDTILWVDWRHEEDETVRECESILKTGSLTAEFEDTDSDAGSEMYIRYRTKRIRVPLVIGFEDRHIALCALNEALHPDYEVRYCIDSGWGDTLAFLPLPTSDWRHLERQYGEAVDKRFYKLMPKPNLFTDTLPDSLHPPVLPVSQASANTRPLTDLPLSSTIISGPAQGNTTKRKSRRPWNQ